MVLRDEAADRLSATGLAFEKGCGSPERKTPCFLVLGIAVIASGAACQFESAQSHRSDLMSRMGLKTPISRDSGCKLELDSEGGSQPVANSGRDHVTVM